jgi:DNA-binding LacI/PurR family transcriptional regulator
MMTFGMLFALRELKLRVPGDLSFVGIDDLEFAGILDPAPTVVATPILPMSRQAIELLLLELAGKSSLGGVWRIHPPQLILRASTSAPRNGR